MKIAVTGASGFIGQHVVAELERRAISPILIVRPTSKIPLSFCKHVVVPIDLNHLPANIYNLLGKPDGMIHLAWSGLSSYTSLHHFEDELPAQYQFIRKIVDSGLQNLLVTGTCFEYGMQAGPLCESTQPLPSNPYGFAKDALRRQLEFLQAVRPFNLTWARLFYLYGTGQAENSLLMQLTKSVEKGDSVFNMSGGEQLRDYLPVSNVANCLVSLTLINKNNGIVNVCSGRPVSVRRLVESWINENKWSISLNLGHYPYLNYEPMAFWGSCEKLNRCIGSNIKLTELKSGNI